MDWPKVSVNCMSFNTFSRIPFDVGRKFSLLIKNAMVASRILARNAGGRCSVEQYVSKVVDRN